MTFHEISLYFMKTQGQTLRPAQYLRQIYDCRTSMISCVFMHEKEGGCRRVMFNCNKIEQIIKKDWNFEHGCDIIFPAINIGR